MSFVQEFIPVALADLHRECAVRKVEGWRFIQTHAVKTDDAVDLYYSFMKDGIAENLKVEGVTKNDVVPSITDIFLAAFVFENEARELFGVDMRDIAIDFSGAMYAPAESEPMTFITPEQKAAREKARKAQAAKAAKDSAPAASAESSPQPAAAHVFVMTPERKQRLDAKLATMSPEKVAKVEAALKAREAEAAAAAAGAQPALDVSEGDTAAQKAQQAQPKAEESPAIEQNVQPADHVLESKIALLDADKASKVRAALAAHRGETPEVQADTADIAPTNDAELEAKLAVMGEEKAAKVRAALAAKAAKKGGE